MEDIFLIKLRSYWWSLGDESPAPVGSHRRRSCGPVRL